MRFTDTPFSNPFASSARVEPQTTASVAPAMSAPSSPVQSQALPPVAPVTAQALPPVSAPAARVVASAPSAVASPVVAGSAVSLPGAKGWTTQGGSTVSVGAGDTVKALSNRYGVPEVAIRAANGLSGNAQPVPGASILIPAYNAAAAAAPATAAPAAVAAAPQRSFAPAKVAAAQPVAASSPAEPVGKARMKLVAGAQPVARQAEAKVAESRPAATKAPEAKVAAAQPVTAKTQPVQTAKAAPAPAATTKAAPAQQVAAAPVPAAPAATPAKVPAKPTVVAKAEPAAEVKAPAPAAATAVTPAPPQAAKPDAAETTGSISSAAKSTEFRWPAKGRIISGFGGKGGASNDGINIAVPEGTPVKAAEGGTVAYAGNELKGYGNLVLIRHPDGWVSAYAHNGELKVKRGDTVSRGQTIAVSGQTGNVSSPQLHFELRKGSTPVDPMPHLAGG